MLIPEIVRIFSFRARIISASVLVFSLAYDSCSEIFSIKIGDNLTTHFNNTSMPEIKELIPHREPFLFVDEIVSQTGDSLVCRKKFTGEEFFFPGHYPGFPLVPGVILCEAAMQAGAALLSLTSPGGEGGKHPVVAKMGEVRFKEMVRPGDEILIEVAIKEKMGDIVFLNAKITKDGKLVLRFEFACAFR